MNSDKMAANQIEMYKQIIVPDNTCYVLLSKLMILYKLTGT
ncbi:hypothetical protein [uncultured Methanomethylovorans sp.]|nr:hypothetical protein [uncultured Methanomethylovorans sp.]